MIEKNKELIRALAEDVIHRGDLERIPEFFAPNYMPHDPSNPGRMGGIEGAVRFISMLHAGMSDIRYTIEDLIAEGDKVVYRWLLRGTHTGTFMGIPPTGNTIAITGIDIFRITGGKIVESWVNADAFGMLQQLGALPPPSALAPLPKAPQNVAVSTASDGPANTPAPANTLAPPSTPPTSVAPTTQRS